MFLLTELETEAREESTIKTDSLDLWLLIGGNIFAVCEWNLKACCEKKFVGSKYFLRNLEQIKKGETFQHLLYWRPDVYEN